VSTLTRLGRTPFQGPAPKGGYLHQTSGVVVEAPPPNLFARPRRYKKWLPRRLYRLPYSCYASAELLLLIFVVSSQQPHPLVWTEQKSLKPAAPLLG